MTRTTRWIAGAAACALALGATAAAGAAKPSPALVKRGAYLVKLGGCNDCHTPLKMGPQGPMPDTDRLLSGHPESAELPVANLAALPDADLRAMFAYLQSLPPVKNRVPEPLPPAQAP